MEALCEEQKPISTELTERLQALERRSAPHRVLTDSEVRLECLRLAQGSSRLAEQYLHWVQTGNWLTLDACRSRVPA